MIFVGAVLLPFFNFKKGVVGFVLEPSRLFTRGPLLCCILVSGWRFTTRGEISRYAITIFCGSSRCRGLGMVVICSLY